MTHMLFAPTGTLKIRSAAYHAVHADLRLSARKARPAKRARKFTEHRNHIEKGDRNG